MTALDFQYEIMNYTSILVNIAARMEVNVQDEIVEGGDLFEILGGIRTTGEAENFFKQLILKIFSRMKGERLHSENYHYSKIMNYLDEHYNEDISIDNLSSSINISPSYIFKILRERKNESFTEYITKKRIDKACELLKTSLKVQEIAQQTGYASANYFIQVFKKYKGCTPNEYKKIKFI